MSIEHTFMTTEGPETRVLTKAKAIRFKCIDCSGGFPSEVAKCTCHDCVLYPFRFGNEKGLERIYVDEKKNTKNTAEDEEIEEVEEKKKVKKIIRKKKIKTKINKRIER